MNRTQSQMDAVLRLELMGHMLTDVTWGGFLHQHDFDELIYVMKGPIVCHCHEKSVTLEKGQLLFFARNTEHSITANDPASFVYIGFKTNMLDVSRYAMEMLDGKQNPQFALFVAQLEEIMQPVFLGEQDFSDCSSRVMAAMLPLFDTLGQEKIAQNSKVILSNQIKQYIKHHFNQPIRVDEIAAGLYHTPHYLGNVFSAVNGMTIKEYVMQFKMQKAIALLQNGGCSVAKAATLLGFDSPHYFSKCFKNYYGFSPSKLKIKE